MLWLFIAGAIFLLLGLILRSNSSPKSSLPPGPRRWPVIGCLPSFPFRQRHREFYKLSQRFGPIMSMPIGSSNLFILHGKELAIELLRSKDSQFSSRPLCMTGHYIGFNHSDPNLSPLNPNWRIVRKAFSNEMMAPFRLSSQHQLRREEILRMIRSDILGSGLGLGQLGSISKGEGGWVNVDVRRFSELLVGRIIQRMLFGEKRLEIAIDEYLTEGNFLWGELNLVDYFPALGFVDPQGLERRFKSLMRKLEPVFRGTIEEHRGRNVEREEDKDVIDILLQNKLSDLQIMGILSVSSGLLRNDVDELFMQDALIPGISTTAAAVEWAMAELAANPRKLLKAQQELDKIVGRSRLMDEPDLPELEYLGSIAKEVLRLHPSAPLDDPHLNEEESSLGGFKIPAKSTVLLNLWALGQDPELWENPLDFTPERFLGSEVDVHGNHFELIPFSSGRRKCPAHQLAMIKLHHIVGVLIHGFDWRSHGDVDLRDGDGIVASPKSPLQLSAKPRLEYSAYKF